MEVTRRRPETAFGWALIALVGIGCGSPQVRLDGVEDCPEDIPSLPPDHPSYRDLACIVQEARKAPSLSARQHRVVARAASDLSAGEADTRRAEGLADEGLHHARRALALEDQPVSHYYVGMLWGLAVARRPLAALKALSSIESHLRRAVQGSPDEDGGGPLRVLGMLYLKAPAWPQGIGDPDKGLALLEQAASSHPEHPLNLLFLAQALKDNEEEGWEDRVAELVRQARDLLDRQDFGWPTQRWRRELESLAP